MASERFHFAHEPPNRDSEVWSVYALQPHILRCTTLYYTLGDPSGMVSLCVVRLLKKLSYSVVHFAEEESYNVLHIRGVSPALEICTLRMVLHRVLRFCAIQNAT